MELKPGYKLTEVGVIPEDWSTHTIKSLIEDRLLLGHLDGNHGELYPRSSEFKEHGVPYVGANDFADGFVTFERCKFLSKERADSFRKGVAKDGDVLFAHNATVGPVALLKTTEAFVILSTTATYFRCNQDRLSNIYLKFALQSPHFVRQYQAVMAQSTRFQVPITTQRKLALVIPPHAEQRAIAGALSDVDALIGVLDQLIAKKRDLKQAAMQQLLTGHQRLPGFTGKWREWKFGELFQFLKTGNNPRSDLFEVGDVGYVHYGDIHTHPSAFLDCHSAQLPRISRAKVNSVPFLEDGDIVMVDASEDYVAIGKWVEVRNASDREIVAGLHTFLLRGDKTLVADGFKGYIQFLPSVKPSLVRFATGISVYGVSKSNVKTIEVSLPSPREQSAIAEVLSDMDAELSALEQKRDKTRLLKQGMMQELLTGRTRLL